MEDRSTGKQPEIAFSIRRFLPSLDTHWTSFAGDYLLYASSGTLNLEVDGRRWLLPPQRAAWAAADVPIKISASGPVETASILYPRTKGLNLPYACRVFAVNQLVHEMVRYALKWDIDQGRPDEVADRFFLSIAHVCLGLADHHEELWLPVGGTDILRRAMDYVVENIGRRLDLATVARHANVSERTLSRHFSQGAGMTCGEFIHRARMIRAAELLSHEDLTVLQVAGIVGYESASSFTEAFRKQMQETPASIDDAFGTPSTGPPLEQSRN